MLAAFVAVGAVAAQDPKVERRRVVWLGEGRDPVPAEACLAMALPAPSPSADLAPGQRSVVGAAVLPARLDLFPGCVVGKTKVAGGSHGVLLERTADGWALVLVGAEALTASDPVAALLASAPVAQLPLRRVGAGEGKFVTFRFVVQEQGQKDDVARLVLSFGGEAYEVALQFPGMKDPPFVPEGLRHASVLWDGDRVVGVLDHGDVAWNDERKAEMGQLGRTARWRLGANWWTSFDVRAPIELGGQKLPAGRFHLVLVRGKSADDWQLACLPVAETLKAGLDAVSAALTKGGALVPLALQTKQPLAGKLRIAFEGAPDARLVIAFGDAVLTAAVRVP
ncbi:MAG: DUF2911 domain-containing protein [Planctomycetes bacterium]|nr:DUF2911 domain-containing protein [Planctomycetota bacterium]